MKLSTFIVFLTAGFAAAIPLTVERAPDSLHRRQTESERVNKAKDDSAGLAIGGKDPNPPRMVSKLE
jgi:hypothetical protein